MNETEFRNSSLCETTPHLWWLVNFVTCFFESVGVLLFHIELLTELKLWVKKFWANIPTNCPVKQRNKNFSRTLSKKNISPCCRLVLGSFQVLCLVSFWSSKSIFFPSNHVSCTLGVAWYCLPLRTTFSEAHVFRRGRKDVKHHVLHCNLRIFLYNAILKIGWQFG